MPLDRLAKSRRHRYFGRECANLDVFLQISNGNVINVLLPSTITYKITSTVPGVKGDRAQAGTKPATIETGMEIQVPLYKEEWDEVVVNTVTGTVN